MNWRLLRWVWQLEGPLHVGMPPSGSLNRCRLYVTARALWGALTAEVARRTSTGLPSYKDVGREIQQGVRVTYLYPAEQIEGDWRAWLPRYEHDRGLVWQREGQRDGDGLEDRAMRSRLIMTRPGTAIDPASDAVAEGTLRETECIGQHWRQSTGDFKPVGLVGYVLIRQGSTVQAALEEIDELFLGGDMRYGLGRVRRVVSEPASQVFGVAADLHSADPCLATERVLAHARVGEGAVGLSGDLEALVWWDDGGLGAGSGAQLYWMPGSAAPERVRWIVDAAGFWVADGTGASSEVGARPLA